jgi:hypothetical protein
MIYLRCVAEYFVGGDASHVVGDCHLGWGVGFGDSGLELRIWELELGVED